MKKLKRIISIILMIILMISNLNLFTTESHASTPMNTAYMYQIGKCNTGLKYYSIKWNSTFDVSCYFTVYEIDGVRYPAYCLNADYDGVGEVGPYTVDVNNEIQDVSSVLDNDVVWRVIMNGYPYKTPEELGVTTIEDAYLVTKRAVHTILNNREVSSAYITSNDHDIVVKNAIERLVNIGRNGTQTRYDDQISIMKIDPLTKKDGYYVQRFAVSGDVNKESYTLKTSNLPNGVIITDRWDQQKRTFGSNETYFLKIPESAMTNNINILMTVQAKCKTYPVFYGATRIANTQNYALTYDPYEDMTAETTFTLNVHQSGLVITKKDAETGQTLSGVTYNAKYDDGTNIGNFTTNSQGKITLTNLRPGNVVLTEISTRDEYILDTTPVSVDIGYQQTKSIELTNNHKKGNLKIIKVDKDNHRVNLGNVEFDLYSDEEQKVIGTYYTDINGEININNLRVGNYRLIEKKTQKWYNLSDDVNVQVRWNTTAENTIENELKKGQIRVIKVDKDNNEVKLEGVKFDILDDQGNVIETIITDKNGEALSSGLPLRDYPQVTLREKETLQNYVLSEETQTIILEENQIKTVTFQNEKKKAKIRVIKVDKDNNEVKLEGVKFDIINDSGIIVDTIITNEQGEAITKLLPIDSEYTIIEKETRREYKLTEEIQTITLEENEIKDITFENELRKGQLKIIKVDKDNNEILLEGVTFDILNEDGEIVDTVVTNELGEATTKLLPCIDKKYTAVEKETLKEYVLTKETQTIELLEDEISTIQFENEMIKGILEITKVDSKTNKTLEGAIFGIYDIEDTQIEEITTDEFGIAKSSLLPYGKYYAKELDTGSVYYLLNENTYEFEISNNHETIPLTIDNDSVDIEVDVEKTGTTEIKPGDKVDYEFSNIENKSNIYLESFKWYDYIPTDYIRLQNMTTGTWNQDLTYSVYYKTNKSEEYTLFKEKLSTNDNYYLDFTTIEFAEDEYIIETCFDFGTVETGFKEIEKPKMQCISFETLENGDTFTNETKTVGTYYELTAEATDKWTTITHKPEEKHEEKLPRTGC